jgi:hypothetical protein
MDLGFLHYGSDTPYTRGKNLGAIRLAYLGMDSAYATSVAILRRMFEMELASLPSEAKPDHEQPTSETASGDEDLHSTDGHRRRDTEKEAATSK